MKIKNRKKRRCIRGYQFTQRHFTSQELSSIAAKLAGTFAQKFENKKKYLNDKLNEMTSFVGRLKEIKYKTKN